jgi:hypothetical protein
MRKEERVERLFDFAAAHEKGWTVHDAARGLRWTKEEVYHAIQALRDVFGEAKDVNLVCEPTGQRQAWLYRLTGKLEDVRWWGHNRTGDAMRRIRTILAVHRSVVAATNGRTLEGKMARVVVRHLQRLVEDATDLIESQAKG